MSAKSPDLVCLPLCCTGRAKGSDLHGIGYTASHDLRNALYLLAWNTNLAEILITHRHEVHSTPDLEEDSILGRGLCEFRSAGELVRVLPIWWEQSIHLQGSGECVRRQRYRC